jgi:hypothetical protein
MGLRDWLTSDSNSDNRVNVNQDSSSGTTVKRDFEQQSEKTTKVSKATQNASLSGDGDFPWLDYPDQGGSQGDMYSITCLATSSVRSSTRAVR